MPFPSPTLYPSEDLFPDSGRIRDLSLGRLRFVTAEGQLKETVGEAFEAVGAALVPGERRPRPFDLTLPVRGAKGDADRCAEGERLRRQVRALFENSAARLQGLWFHFAIDAQLDAWLLAGGGDLAYSDQGGVTFSDYLLSLTDTYRLATPHTHRPARRLESRDRRLSTVARDCRGQLFSTDFAAVPASVRHYLPAGASELRGYKRAIVPSTTRLSIDGYVVVVADRPHGETVSFDQLPAAPGASDVVALDRQGNLAPAATRLGDQDPQTEYGWEELYGPMQAMTAGDVPVLQNGVTRIRWVPDRHAFAVDSYVAATGYAEQARVTVWRDEPAGTEIQYATLVSARLVEWTPERAVVRADLSIDADNVCEVYLTLQRGWAGPRIEAYGAWTGSGKPGTALRVSPAAAGTVELGRSSTNTNIVNGTNHISPWSAIEPWAYLLPPDPALAIHLAVLQGALKGIGRSDSAAYGAARNSLSVAAQVGTALAGYVSATLGFGPRATAAAAARALGRENLHDCRAIPDLVAR